MIAARRYIPGKRLELPDAIDSQPHDSLDPSATTNNPLTRTHHRSRIETTTEMRLIAVHQETTKIIFGPPLYCVRKGIAGQKNELGAAA
jgi:hypothetical protein